MEQVNFVFKVSAEDTFSNYGSNHNLIQQFNLLCCDKEFLQQKNNFLASENRNTCGF